MSIILSTPATSEPNIAANKNTANVRRHVSRLDGQATCLTSFHEFTKYRGTSKDNTFLIGLNTNLKGSQILLVNLFFLDSTETLVSVLTFTVGAFLTLGPLFFADISLPIKKPTVNGRPRLSILPDRNNIYKC